MTTEPKEERLTELEKLAVQIVSAQARKEFGTVNRLMNPLRPHELRIIIKKLAAVIILEKTKQ